MERDPVSGEAATSGDVGGAPHPTDWEAAVELAPGEQVGAFRVLEKLAEGGFGAVYAAEQERPVRRLVALKVLKAGMDTRAVVARFEAERQALALMDHPAIAKVFDAGATASGRPFFAMELVRGVPITEYCDTHRLSVRERLELFLPVCMAVHHAHQKGIIHRDIKPSNVLVTLVDGAPAPKVIDFGIAKATRAAGALSGATLHTMQGQIIGTPEYMSPEQADHRGLDIDTRADVYSLGVLLYELLTGSLPFDTERLRTADAAEIVRILRESEPIRASTRVSGESSGAAGARAASRRRAGDARSLQSMLRGDLDWITLKAMEKDRTRRYDSAAGLAEDVRRHLAMQPVSAGPPTAAYRVGKFVRRHRGGVTAAALFGVLMIAGFAGTAAMWRRAEAARERSEIERARAQAALLFLKDMFNSIDPAKAQGREVTVKDVLDPAAERAGAALGSQPEVEATVRGLIGEAYFHLGQFALARENLERSAALRESALGIEHPETLTSLFNAAAASISLGDYHKAEGPLARSLEVRRGTLGPTHEETLASMSLMGHLRHLQGDHAGAEAIVRETLAAQEAAGLARPALETRNTLADLLQDMGRLEEAEETASECLRLGLERLGPDDPLTIEARSILGSVLLDLGRTEEAEAALRESVAARVRVHGEGHLSTLTSKNILAQALAAMGREADAAGLYWECMRAAAQAFGRENRNYLVYAVNYGQSLTRLGRIDEAVTVLREAAEAESRVSGPESLGAAIAWNSLGLALIEQGGYAEALGIMERVRDLLPKVVGEEHFMHGAARSNIGLCLLEMGRRAEALAVLEEAHGMLLSTLGAEHPRTVRCAELLGRAREVSQ